MKKTIVSGVLVICMFFLIGQVGAQEKQMPPASKRAAKITEWMKTNLSLSADQEPKVQDINLKYATKVDEVKSSTDDRKKKMKTLKSNEAAKDAELKSIFTDSQYQTYLSKKDEMKKKLKEKRKEKKQE